MGISKQNNAIRRASPSLRLRWRKYRDLGFVAYRRAVNYRLAYLLGLLGNIIRVIAFLALWQAALSIRNGAGMGGYDSQTLLTYVLVAFMLDGLISFRTESQIAQSVRSGDVNSDMVRPLDHQTVHFSYAIGNVLVEGIWLVAITAVIGSLWVDVLVPQDWETILWFLLSVLLAIVIKYDIAYLTGVAAFWLTDIRGLIVTRATVVGILGGAYFPLDLLPHSIRQMLGMLPFAGTVAFPARIFTGQLSGSALWISMGLQLFWAIVLWWVAKLIWKRAMGRFNGNGG